jgi:hypothetical protein
VGGNERREVRRVIARLGRPPLVLGSSQFFRQGFRDRGYCLVAAAAQAVRVFDECFVFLEDALPNSRDLGSTVVSLYFGADVVQLVEWSRYFTSTLFVPAKTDQALLD